MSNTFELLQVLASDGVTWLDANRDATTDDIPAGWVRVSVTEPKQQIMLNQPRWWRKAIYRAPDERRGSDPMIE